MKWHTILVGLVLCSAFSCCAAADEDTYSAPGIGYIEIRSSLEGARVYFDTLYMGYVSGGALTVPVDTTVTPSWNNVRMEYTGFYSFAGPFIQTEAGKTIAYQIDLRKTSYDTSGMVTFISEPAGAEFFLDGRSVGVTPDSGVLVAYTVPRGLHTVETRRPGDSPVLDELYVDDNAAATYRVQLTPSPFGKLQVNSTPGGADIYLDNLIVGKTPLLIPEVLVGEHALDLRRSGCQDWSANISVVGGSQGVVEAILVEGTAPAAGTMSCTEG